MFFLLLSSALAGDIVVDAKVPTEIRARGLPIASLTWPAEVRLTDLEPGLKQFEVFVAGTGHSIEVLVPASGETWVVVGESGVSVAGIREADAAAKVEADAPVQVEFRSLGPGKLTLQIDGQRHSVEAGQPLSMELTSGSHPVKLRSYDGTVIYAHGTLELASGFPAVVQLAEGRVPEVAGRGASWQSARH